MSEALTAAPASIDVQLGVLTHRLSTAERDISQCSTQISELSAENRLRAERQEKQMHDGFESMNAKIDRMASWRGYISFSVAIAIGVAVGVAAHTFGFQP
ncbi:hypothetical protein [Acetobacter aceti]|uniref:hypothetical protein n=1 Tax=Acetobacter aceti TaxID=435 RepID=UPI000C0756FB|nr:hypothetical protein [Acetobacter aceti]